MELSAARSPDRESTEHGGEWHSLVDRTGFEAGTSSWPRWAPTSSGWKRRARAPRDATGAGADKEREMMKMLSLVLIVAALVIGLPQLGFPQADDEIKALRKEVEALREGQSTIQKELQE